MKSWDVIIVGGGIIGLSLSSALRKRGARVLIIERGEPGHEASRAAGGMLVDCPLETPPVLQPLATTSAQMYPEFARELELESGMKVDLRDQGTILFPDSKHFDHPAIRNQMRANAISMMDLAQLEPELPKRDSDKVELEPARQELFPENSLEEIELLFKSIRGQALYLKERSVDPRALTAAAIKAAKHRGVDFSSGDSVTAINISDGYVSGVTTSKTTFFAEKVVNCAGAWSSQIGPHPIPTRPVKGQMLCLAMPSRDLLKHVIRSPKVYLIPRSDGRLLVGATVEEAGFDKRTEAATILGFHHAAIELVPKLRDARILEDWAGLRPGTPDNLPILGATATPGYYIATGHFRDGILLAPVTAQVMAELIMDAQPSYDLLPFSPSRFAS
ncbi:MAG: glycine oxidase ThiO [Candidatus Sulfotelmatobacter sp.]